MRVKCSREKREKVWQHRVHSEAPAGWVTLQGGDSLLPQCQPGRVLCCQLLLKQNRGDRRRQSPIFLLLLLSLPQCPAFIPHPISSKIAASFLFHLLPRPDLIHLYRSPQRLCVTHGEEEQISAYLVIDLFGRIFWWLSVIRMEIFFLCSKELKMLYHISRTALSVSVILEFKDSMFNKSKYQATLLHFLATPPLLPILLSASACFVVCLWSVSFKWWAPNSQNLFCPCCSGHFHHGKVNTEILILMHYTLHFTYIYLPYFFPTLCSNSAQHGMENSSKFIRIIFLIFV